MRIPQQLSSVIGALCIVHILCQVDSAAASAIYSRSSELPPIRLSQSELFSIIERMRAFLDSANRGVADTWRQENLELEGGARKLSLQGRFRAFELVGAPEFSQRVNYSYRLSDAPVSAVAVRLSDYSREVVIEGTSREQVDGLLSVLSDEFNARATWLGGFHRRSLGGFLLLLVGWSLIVFATAESSQLRKVAFFVAGPLLIVSTIALPWADWLPGTAVYPGEASWLVRNSPILSLLGVVLTIVTFIISLMYSTRLARASAALPARGDTPETQRLPEGSKEPGGESG